MKKIKISHTDKDTTKQIKKIHTQLNHLYEYTHEQQLNIINNIYQSIIENIHLHDNKYQYLNETSRFFTREIKKKLCQYIQQDKQKEYVHIKREQKDNESENDIWFNNKQFYINIKDIIEKIVQQNLLCYYCMEPVFVLYKYRRFNKQWTLERLDNSYGHTKTNCVIACLECNISRNNIISNEKYKFSKQINVNKID